MKSNRHSKIIELINRFPITTQEALLEHLKTEGFDVTQSTVSRDIKKLRLSKSLDQNGNYRYQAPQKQELGTKNGFATLVNSSVISVDYAMNMVVVKTYAGMAQAVCAAFDSIETESVVGTLAGDDTIFIVCKNEESARYYKEDFLVHIK
ncbi:MAG: arginine repressor [Ruminococcus sp.]|nr:arginine repressor [Ruminococcus sp.]